MQLPSEIGVMTLPNAILFPQALLPLYIFEPRYREMLKKSLEEQRMFAVALANKSGPHRVAGIGLIRACVDKPDGTSTVILQGVSRVRFTEFVQDEPYYVGRIEVLRTEETDGVEVDALAAKLVELLDVERAKGEVVPDSLFKLIEEIKDYGALADIVSYSFLEDIRVKQQILETVNLPQRLRKVVMALKKQAKLE